jgi:hypothetical protein
MSSQKLPLKYAVSLLAAVWVMSSLAAWIMELNPDEDDLFLVVVFFFRYVPMVAAIGALFGRPTFGAALGIATLVALAGIETANALIGTI